MSETFYVLMEAGWEYDDNNYSRSNGGNPEKVFSDKEKAETEATKLNLETFKSTIKSGDIRDYGYDFNDVLSDKTTEDDIMFEEGIFMTLFGKTGEDWWDGLYNGKPTFKTEPTEMQWIRLMHCFNLRFFEVVGVEKG